MLDRKQYATRIFSVNFISKLLSTLDRRLLLSTLDLHHQNAAFEHLCTINLLPVHVNTSMLLPLAEFEKRRKEREETQEDAVTLRLRLAEEQKRKKMEEFEKQAKGGKKDVGIVEQALRAKLAAADAEKQKKIETITEIGKAMTQVYHAGWKTVSPCLNHHQCCVSIRNVGLF